MNIKCAQPLRNVMSLLLPQFFNTKIFSVIFHMNKNQTQPHIWHLQQHTCMKECAITNTNADEAHFKPSIAYWAGVKCHKFEFPRRQESELKNSRTQIWESQSKCVTFASQQTYQLHFGTTATATTPSMCDA